MLSDFGQSLTVLSRKGLEGIEREMRDLALLLGAAGIVQVQCCPAWVHLLHFKNPLVAHLQEVFAASA